jgi:hypothetical protein
MSLILTTNTSTNDPTANNVGINLPYDYMNFTTNTFEIEADSEVAVQSIKFNKEGNIEVNRSNNQFYVYLGRKDGEDNQFTTSVCHHTQLGNPEVKFEQYNNVELQTIIKEAIDRGLKHPDMLKNDTNNSSGAEVDISRDSEGKFKGYTYKINYGLSASLTDKKSDSGFVDSLRNSDYSGSWNTSNHRITKDAGKTCEMIGAGGPLSQCNGSLGVDFKEAGGLWAIGLTRYLDEYADDYNQQNYAHVRPQGLSFYDYVAKSVFDTTSGKYYLRVYHAVQDNRRQGEYIHLQEIDYTGVTPLIEIFSESGSYGAASISRLEWNIQNEKVALFVSSEDGTTTKHTLFNGSNASKLKNLKPTSSNTKFLYPKVKVSEDSKYLTILKSNMIIPTGFLYGDNLGTGGIDAGTLGFGKRYMDFGAQAFHFGGQSLDLMRTLDLRPIFDYDGDNEDVAYTQFGLNGSGAFYQPGIGATSYGTCFVLAQDLEVDEDTPEFFPSVGANAKDILGFNDDPYVIVPNASTTLSETFVSLNVPEQISTNSIFVRLNNFLQRSINGQTNGVSKIIYHVPRFDNAGNEFGGLFFEPGERVYIKLHNTTRLMRNEFSLSLVNPDETLATNITGKTIIMLHFRKAR